MSQFKFSVGEPVILQCLDYPHLNGEYTVTHCIHAHEVYPDPEFGQALRAEILGYFLDGARLILQDADGKPATALWFEGALRKKYQPGDLSFNELLKGIGSPDKQKAKEAEPCA
ncbi:hypothetical protein [Pseudomonas viridiflava]|uniref:hypothetical protein n=1 Tax=Pseudomonas viridiflava TaxID=33069 RepID=UPI000F03536F|nr:hypothetical protein [Pseudomonas viridiflava]